jgi:ribonuclease P protein component
VGSARGRPGLPPARKLRRPAEFAAVAAPAAAAGIERWRAARRLIAVQALIGESMTATTTVLTDAGFAVRFGFTVGKRNARRAVDRARVKRVLREAARHAGPALEPAGGGRRVAVVLRLKTALPAPDAISLAALKRQLRDEADALLAQLAQHLQRGQPA